MKELLAKAMNGDDEAQREVGNAYRNFTKVILDENGKLDVNKTLHCAKEWLEKSASCQNNAACVDLGDMLNMEMEERDLCKEEACKWYKAAAERGDATAQNRLGLLYESGSPAERDYEMAFYWYAKAAEKGHVLSFFNLGMLYRTGKGVKQNTEKAIYWLEKAMDAGDNMAPYYLGELYESGLGFSPDLQKAVDCYGTALDRGTREAALKLGKLFFNQEQYDDALFFFNQALKLGGQHTRKAHNYINLIEELKEKKDNSQSV